METIREDFIERIFEFIYESVYCDCYLTADPVLAGQRSTLSLICCWSLCNSGVVYTKRETGVNKQ